MIKEWSLKLNDDQTSYSLTTEDDQYRWIIHKVQIKFDDLGFPCADGMKVLLDNGSSFTMLIPDNERKVL